MLKQRITSLRPLTISAEATEADLTDLKGLLAGEIESFENKGQGGTTAVLPETLNKKVFIVGAKSAEGRISTQVTIPHVKESRHYTEVSTDIIGKFFANYEVATKSDYAKLRFDA